MTAGSLLTEEEGLEKLVTSKLLNTTMPIDPFNHADGVPRQYQYYKADVGESRWLIASVGPDGDFDVLDALLELRTAEKEGGPSLTDFDTDRTAKKPVTMTREQSMKFRHTYSYDPTNGSTSGGDIFRFGRY